MVRIVIVGFKWDQENSAVYWKGTDWSEFGKKMRECEKAGCHAVSVRFVRK